MTVVIISIASSQDGDQSTSRQRVGLLPDLGVKSFPESSSRLPIKSYCPEVAHDRVLTALKDRKTGVWHLVLWWRRLTAKTTGGKHPPARCGEHLALCRPCQRVAVDTSVMDSADVEGSEDSEC